MLDEINQIKKWLKKNVGNVVSDGDYSIPINGVLYVVTIKNDYIHGMRKAKRGTRKIKK